MIYLLEVPQMKVELIQLGMYGQPVNYSGRKELQPFRCSAHGPGEWRLVPAFVYPQKTLLYQSEVIQPGKNRGYWAEVTFKNLMAFECQEEMDGTVSYVCHADEFMITLESRDEKLNWLEQQALAIDRNNYLVG